MWQVRSAGEELSGEELYAEAELVARVAELYAEAELVTDNALYAHAPQGGHSPSSQSNVPQCDVLYSLHGSIPK